MEILKLCKAKWVAISISSILILAAAAHAQDASDATTTITSNPPGATVVLTGDMTVAGVTPARFTQRLVGFYRIEAYRDGFESYRSSVVLSGSQPTNIDINLKPKTRIKAAMRSLIIPGWGQRYTGANAKGNLLFAGIIVGGATAGILHLKFDHDRDDYYDYLDLYNAERSVAERELMLPELQRRQEDAHNMEQARNTAGAIVIGIWAYSVLDAIIFFPDYGITISGASLSFSPEYDGREVKFMGRLTF